jgi:hypothetical protein
MFWFSGMMHSKNQPESLQDPSIKNLTTRSTTTANKPAVATNRPATTTNKVANKPASSGCVLCGGAKKTRRARPTRRKRVRKGRRTQKRRARRTRRR